ncbi:hypothetical protein H9L15_05985 [Sphingomonas daechungensis]|uniref:Ubiquinol-cytochrome c chaperone domain-containing protein n=1 Tax=Sphingomonas daechungensis TaxID=1176646 RepID=A0ABX6T2K1_9SPHN|nr:ubiquinol-cytochrome C chaperone family protein [Sphingomonas daechungensis]QNP44091.1 hypothetical protein H9L15_05985 [Sphingomonas daechungensis]
MFRALFARLTDEPKRGQALFRLAVAEARRPDWYLRGQVPDTVNGRFAVLATIVALLMVRLDRDGEPGKDAGTALTERLVESLDAEIREMGTGDPTLGKQVRQLVGAVAGRADRWASWSRQRKRGARSSAAASIWMRPWRRRRWISANRPCGYSGPASKSRGSRT